MREIRLIEGKWENHPDHLLYPENWYFISPTSEILANVRQFQSEPWQAYIRGRACRSGSFMLKEAAMKAVEEDLASGR